MSGMRELDSKLSRYNIKTALSIYDYPLHLENLQAVQQFFLPKNTMSLAQPMDNGICTLSRLITKKCSNGQGLPLSPISILAKMKFLMLLCNDNDPNSLWALLVICSWYF